MDKFTPGYQHLLKSGDLDKRIAEAYDILSSCRLCPRACHVNRLKGERGYCGSGAFVEIASIGPHFGEEPPLSGDHGAGTVFFTHCSLKCCYCQNYQISHEGSGKRVDEDTLAQAMLQLQDQGCHNIDLVTPGHYLPFVFHALRSAAGRGLVVPLVYNCSGYESLESLRLLDGVVDIYMPDWKYSDPYLAAQYSHAPDYPGVCEKAVREMHRQVGDLVVDENGIAQRGIIVRHLVLPHHLDNTQRVLALLARGFPEATRISLMAQYVPCFRADQHPCLRRPLTPEEYERALEMMEEHDFVEYWVQDLESSATFTPDFTQKNPFS